MISNEDFIIIKHLTEIQSCSGDESKIRDYIKKTVESFCDNVDSDILGNLFCLLKGKAAGEEDKLTILLDAHMDEKS